MCKVGCFVGAYGDSTPFTDCTVEDIAKNLEKRNRQFKRIHQMQYSYSNKSGNIKPYSYI